MDQRCSLYARVRHEHTNYDAYFIGEGKEIDSLLQVIKEGVENPIRGEVREETRRVSFLRATLRQHEKRIESGVCKVARQVEYQNKHAAQKDEHIRAELRDDSRG